MTVAGVAPATPGWWIVQETEDEGCRRLPVAAWRHEADTVEALVPDVDRPGHLIAASATQALRLEHDSTFTACRCPDDGCCLDDGDLSFCQECGGRRRP